jgi:YhgE/Pip-like protein
VSASHNEGAVGQVRASGLLRARALWILPAITASVVIVLMTVVYLGAIVDPTSHLHGLPVLVVNEDRGGQTPKGRIDLGNQIATGLTGTTAITSRLSLESVSLPQAEALMNRGADYAALVIPPRFTNSVLALTGLEKNGGRATRPTLDLTANERAGSLGVSLATDVLQPALQVASRRIGHQVVALSSAAARSNPAIEALLSDPVTVATVQYRPLPSNSALGLSAFYVSLLTMMCGFLGAIIVNNTVDAALGQAATEIGPNWKLNPFRKITRWQTLLTKWVISAGVIPLVTALMLVVAIAGVNMDAPHFGFLWVFVSFAAISVAVGTLTLFASLGSIGQLIAILIFVYLGLASSGGTVPVQALPDFYRVASIIEPFRQILGAARGILYFNAQANAGVTRGFVLAAIGLAFWILAGATVTTWYDRKGLYRRAPESDSSTVVSR